MQPQISLPKQNEKYAFGDPRYSTDYVDSCPVDRVSSAFFGACLVIVRPCVGDLPLFLRRLAASRSHASIAQRHYCPMARCSSTQRQRLDMDLLPSAPRTARWRE